MTIGAGLDMSSTLAQMHYTRDQLIQLAIQLLLLATTLACLIWAVVRIREFFRASGDVQGSDDEIRDQIREIYRQGDLSEEEFRSINSHLSPHDEGVVRSERPASPEEAESGEPARDRARG
jgi:hypothetical protein